jgi:monoamine oxidase
MSGRLPSEVDVAVIGVGAAGIGAGRRAKELGLSVLLIEARDRLGGRAWSWTAPIGTTVDLGCEWLHSGDRNPWTAIARRAGFTVDERLPGWGRLRRAGGDAEQAGWERASDAFEERVAARRHGPDCAAAELLEPGCRWNPLLEAISSYVSGAELAHVSAQDLAHYNDSGVNWRIREGYGTAIAAHGEGLPVALNAPVRRIDRRGRDVVVESDAGTLRARTAIVTLPTSLIAAEAVRFEPPLPPELLAAAHELPLGVADKAFIAIESGFTDFAADTHLIGATDRVATGSYQVKPFGLPVIEAFFGGTLARELEAGGPEAMAAFAVDELVEHLGSDVRRRLCPLVATAWAHDPFAGGSYSYARPGGADARARLAAPLDERILFAGEACSPHDFSTAHGAYETGVRAAERAARFLGR